MQCGEITGIGETPQSMNTEADTPVGFRTRKICSILQVPGESVEGKRKTETKGLRSAEICIVASLLVAESSVSATLLGGDAHHHEEQKK
jgi:hypothetical protein